MVAVPIIGGTLFAFLSAVGIVINVIVLYAIIKGRLLFKGHNSSVYILSVSSISMDILMIVIHVVYLIPAIYLQSWLFAEGIHAVPVMVVSFLLMYCWHYSTLSHILIATTRLYAWKYTTLSNKRTLTLLFITHALSLGGTGVSEEYFYYVLYSYEYHVIGNSINYSNDFIELPSNIFCSLCSLVCYSAIFLYMRWMSKAATGEVAMKRRQQEYVYAMQFAVMAAFYTISWLSFRIIPIFLGDDPQDAWIYGITTIFTLLNSWSNAFVYLVNNMEIRKALRNTMRKATATSSSR